MAAVDSAVSSSDTIGEIRNGSAPSTGLFSQISLSTDTVSPGEFITSDIEVQTNEGGGAGSAEWVYTVYKCGTDQSCDNPPTEDVNGDGVLDSCQITGDVNEGKDDCVDSFTRDVEQDFLTGWDLWTTIDYRVDSQAEPGLYVAESFIWDKVEAKIISDSPSQTFNVVVPEPVIEADGEPVISSDGDSITASVELVNNGAGDMDDSHIIELQVREQGSGPLSVGGGGLFSFVSGEQRLCDSSHPENVHKEFRLDAGDSEQVTLSVDAGDAGLEQGESYTAWVITRSSCFNTGENNPVPPFGTGVSGDITLEAGESTETGGLTTAGWVAIGAGVLVIILGVWRWLA